MTDLNATLSRAAEARPPAFDFRVAVDMARRRARARRIGAAAVVVLVVAAGAPFLRTAIYERGVAGRVGEDRSRGHAAKEKANVPLRQGSSTLPSHRSRGSSTQGTASNEKVQARSRTGRDLTGRVAFIDNSGLEIVDLGSRHRAHVSNLVPMDLAWSSDGSTLAYSTWNEVTSTIETLTSDGIARRVIVTMNGKRAYSPSWSPDGKRLVFAVDSAAAGSSPRAVLELWMVNADGSGLKRVTTPAGEAPDEPAWSPDGKRIAYTSQPAAGPVSEYGQGTIKILDLANGTSTGVDQGGQSAWSPDGRSIALVATDQGIEVVNIATRERTKLDPGQPTTYAAGGYDNHPTFSPDGRWVAYARTDPGPPEVGGRPAHLFVSPVERTESAPLHLDGWSPVWRGTP